MRSLSLIWALVGVGGQPHTQAALPPGKRPKRPGIYCTGGWMGPRAGMDSCGKYRLTAIGSPDLPACSESLYGLHYTGPSYIYTRVYRFKYDTRAVLG